MTAITTPRLKESTDSLLRFAMRADAICSGLMRHSRYSACGLVG